MSFLKHLKLSPGDLDFLVETVSPEVRDTHRIKQILSEDADFRNQYIDDERVFDRAMADKGIFLTISLPLFFEILLRKAIRDLSKQRFTIEKTRTMEIPVFDAEAVVALFASQPLDRYLAHMLTTFTKVESFSFSFRDGKGFRRKIRFNDMDIESLKAFCDVVEDDLKFGLYKRIGDICLFILGIFPDFAVQDLRYPHSGEIRPQIPGHLRIGPDDYEQEGQKFYKLAAGHQYAERLEMADMFTVLHENFNTVRKPLNFIAEHYLRRRKERLFG